MRAAWYGQGALSRRYTRTDPPADSWARNLTMLGRIPESQFAPKRVTARAAHQGTRRASRASVVGARIRAMRRSSSPARTRRQTRPVRETSDVARPRRAEWRSRFVPCGPRDSEDAPPLDRVRLQSAVELDDLSARRCALGSM